MITWIVIVLAWYAAWSAATFGAYAWDKRAAINARRRVRERTLHALELAGGWPGALAAQRMLRHKSSDRWFRFVTRAMAGGNLGALAIVLAIAANLSRGG